MFRGNLGMSREAFPVLSREVIIPRSAEKPWCDRKVYFHALITPEKVKFTIRDQGEGFDTSQLPNASDPESFRDGIGRGLVLIQAFMDEVNFSDSGRQLDMCKFAAGAAKITKATTPK